MLQFAPLYLSPRHENPFIKLPSGRSPMTAGQIYNFVDVRVRVFLEEEEK
jgi:hypothetical protein